MRKPNTSEERAMDSPSLVWGFAYGSNLCTKQLLERIGIWKEDRRAHLYGWSLRFNVPSRRWGGGTASIIETGRPENVVHGAIYLIDTNQLETLSRFEGKLPQSVTAISEGKGIEAMTGDARSIPDVSTGPKQGRIWNRN